MKKKKFFSDKTPLKLKKKKSPVVMLLAPLPRKCVKTQF